MHPILEHLIFNANNNRIEGRNRQQYNNSIGDFRFNTGDLNNTIDQNRPKDIYRAFHAIAAEYIFFLKHTQNIPCNKPYAGPQSKTRRLKSYLVSFSTTVV